MKFYYQARNKDNNLGIVRCLQEACVQADIECLPIYTESFDYTNLPEFQAGDILYRTSIDKQSGLIGKLLGSTAPVVTVFRDWQALLAFADSLAYEILVNNAAGLPINRTIFDVPRDRTLLAKYVDHLEGFPVIIKALGGSHGVGVMRVDSLASLQSVADFLSSADGTFIMRQYIPHDIHARLIVLGDKVIDSIAYERAGSDFRTNVGNSPIVHSRRFGDEIDRIAVEATRVLGAEFSGVDILIDKDGKPHIAEVNSPCFFPRAQRVTGTDIAGMLVRHLIDKSRRLYG